MLGRYGVSTLIRAITASRYQQFRFRVHGQFLGIVSRISRYRPLSFQAPQPIIHLVSTLAMIWSGANNYLRKEIDVLV